MLRKQNHHHHQQEEQLDRITDWKLSQSEIQYYKVVWKEKRRRRWRQKPCTDRPTDRNEIFSEKRREERDSLIKVDGCSHHGRTVTDPNVVRCGVCCVRLRANESAPLFPEENFAEYVTPWPLLVTCNNF